MERTGPAAVGRVELATPRLARSILMVGKACMTSRHRGFRSSIVKKLVTGFTGLALMGFIVAHLAGNLLLLAGAEAFNEYAHFLHTFLHGGFVVVAEVGLVAVFLFHIVSVVRVWLDKRAARPDRYHVVGDAGGPSQKSLASRSMIVTGLVLLVFVVDHVGMFRVYPIEPAGYVTIIDGHQARDLHRWVVEWFQIPWVVGAYVAAMLFLGFHLRHGFWSAFQSVGANNRRWMPFLTAAGVVFAVVMAVGFLFLPLYLYLFVDPPAAAAAAAAGGPS